MLETSSVLICGCFSILEHSRTLNLEDGTQVYNKIHYVSYYTQHRLMEFYASLAALPVKQNLMMWNFPLVASRRRPARPKRILEHAEVWISSRGRPAPYSPRTVHGPGSRASDHGLPVTNPAHGSRGDSVRLRASRELGRARFPA